MMITRLVSSNKLSLGTQFDIPLEYKGEFLQEILRTNNDHERTLSFILIAVDIFLLGIDFFTINVLRWDKHIFAGFNYIHSLLFFLPLAFLLFNYFRTKISYLNLIPIKSLHLLLNFLVLALCASIGVLNELANQWPFAYIIALFSIASVVILNTSDRLLIFIVTDIIYIIGVISVQQDITRLLASILFSIILTVVALIVAQINYHSYSRNFILKRIIVGEKQELNNMYNLTEDALKKCTDELNKAIEYENLRTAFFTNLSHELRTPLNIIYSAQQMLDFTLASPQSLGDNREVRGYIRMIKQNCYRLTRLIGNLIDITKMDAGYFKVDLKNCDIVRIVENISLSAANYIKSMGLNLIFDTEVEEKMVACDPDEIERIMLNLLSNAVKFTPAGGEIFVNVYERKNKVVISVKDTGIGIPHEMKDLIFERFIQVDKTTTRSKEGSGIGLSIVKSLVQMHGGSISIISEQGKGSEFITEIPDITVPEESCNKEYNLIKEDQKTERINIEFSDIYAE